ncbi:MAG: hypothetical protein KJ601_02395 [Nanoarchaeota archaeon]|nr:hypothetical protein [Nanoarchaeota archaeon]
MSNSATTNRCTTLADGCSECCDHDSNGNQIGLCELRCPVGVTPSTTPSQPSTPPPAGDTIDWSLGSTGWKEYLFLPSNNPASAGGLFQLDLEDCGSGFVGIGGNCVLASSLVKVKVLFNSENPNYVAKKDNKVDSNGNPFDSWILKEPLERGNCQEGYLDSLAGHCYPESFYATYIPVEVVFEDISPSTTPSQPTPLNFKECRFDLDLTGSFSEIIQRASYYDKQTQFKNGQFQWYKSTSAGDGRAIWQEIQWDGQNIYSYVTTYGLRKPDLIDQQFNIENGGYRYYTGDLVKEIGDRSSYLNVGTYAKAYEICREKI